MSTVIHINSAAHAASKKLCESRGWRMSEWASAVLLDAAHEGMGAPSSVGPVGRQDVGPLPTQETDANERPPFWAGRKGKA